MSHTPFDDTARVPLGRRLLTFVLFACLSLAAVLASAHVALGQSSGSPNLVVSQIYTRGGEPGAAHPVDFIEIFNRGSNTVDLGQYSLQVTTTEGNTTSSVIVTFVSSRGGVPIRPGEYRVVTFGGGPPPPPPFPPPTTLGPTGKIAIVHHKEALPQVDCPLGLDPAIEDYVGYGAASCFEGGGPAPTPTLAAAAFRNSGGCSDTNSNSADFALAGAPAPRDGIVSPCPLPPSTSTFRFTNDFPITSENETSVQVTVTRTGGDLSTPATVDYSTADFTASERKDYTTAIGTLRFAPGETSKTFSVFINNDAFAEGGAEFFDIVLSNPTGTTALADPALARVAINDNDTTNGAANPIDDSTFFVRAHYVDFLGREPDAPGLAFWTNEIESCGADAQCRGVKRINVSAAFFLSIEFQETGYFTYRLFKASFPNSQDTAARPRGFPTYREFIRDATEARRDVVVGVGNWQQQIEANKQALANAFVNRAEFLALYPAALSPQQFVDALNSNAGGPLSQSERDALVADLTAAGNTAAARADALRRVADDEDFRRAELNRAFVLMQYFGYLRRSPNAAPDTNFDGYDFWLSKLNQFNGNFIQAEMVKAFISSDEYRHRFGQ